MSYILSGRLQARCSAEFSEPVANETVLLYWVPEREPGTFSLRAHQEIRDREYLLLAQGRTDDEGRFRIVLDGSTIHSHRGSRREYAGEPLALEVCYRGGDPRADATQFHVGHLRPDWKVSSGDHVASTEHVIQPDQWSRVRAALDLWTIAGTVRLSDGSPAADHKVLAYDADALHDDFLGSAESAADGTFRIDYKGSTFRPRPVAGIDAERGGPEVYFKVQAPDGSVVYSEPSSRGKQSDRRNSPNWVTEEIALDPADQQQLSILNPAP